MQHFSSCRTRTQFSSHSFLHTFFVTYFCHTFFVTLFSHVFSLHIFVYTFLLHIYITHFSSRPFRKRHRSSRTRFQRCLPCASQYRLTAGQICDRMNTGSNGQMRIRHSVLFHVANRIRLIQKICCPPRFPNGHADSHRLVRHS